MSNVIDMRPRLEAARGRTPLYVSHLRGRVAGSPHMADGFGDRLVRIRASLDKINRLMTELRKMGEKRNES